ncbi:MAG: flagellar motor switch protein FliG [Piscirickettsiaceae bacterium]|nr:MAG: flagellar motor switch protein FliG [Piscirickettsiaceae bacterium]PCI70997.1 MAG: flagellar motor switch protein FliG [Piscirickettsiaceae bacterium]
MDEQVKTEESMNGVQKAAVLLLSLGEDHAAGVMKHMGPKEVQQVGSAMATLENVTTETLDSVVGHFITTIGGQTALGIDSDKYIKNVLTNALGADKASGVIDRILLGRNSKGLEQLKWMDPRSIAGLIRLEHPQIIAIVLSYLDSDQAAETLSYIAPRARADILMRVAVMEGVQPAALQELDAIMEKQLSGNSGTQSASMGGIQTAANMLNFMEGSMSAELIDSVVETDEEIGQLIQDKMFVFDNLIDVDDRGIQALMKEISTDILTLALRAAEEGLKEKIFANMSKRAAEMLRDDMEAAPPAKVSDVEAAQKEVLIIARRLSDSGEISLGGGGGDDFV